MHKITWYEDAEIVIESFFTESGEGERQRRERQRSENVRRQRGRREFL
jgi:hypothetical protein